MYDAENWQRSREEVRYGGGVTQVEFQRSLPDTDTGVGVGIAAVIIADAEELSPSPSLLVGGRQG